MNPSRARARARGSYFEASAQTGNPDGLYNAGLLLREGRGVPRDEARALAYMTRAAHQARRLRRRARARGARGGPVLRRAAGFRWLPVLPAVAFIGRG